MRYVGRNLRIIAELVQKSPLMLLDGHQYRNLLVVQELYRQQLEMYQEKKHSIPDRIVSLHMPFVRPIVRGKKNASVEFGPKLAVSIVDGFTFMENLALTLSMKALHSRIRWNDSRSVMDITQLWSMPIRSTGTETISDSAKAQHTPIWPAPRAPVQGSKSIERAA